MVKLQHAGRILVTFALCVATVALGGQSPADAQAQSAWEGPIVRQPAAEDRLVEVMNQLRTTVYGLPALTYRPFAGADITYIECLVQNNRSRTTLEHYPVACGRTVQDGGAEVLAWNWNSIGGTTNDLVNAWNRSEGHRHLMLGTGDQVSAGVFCIGSTAYGVAWFRRADGGPAQGSPLARIDPAGPTYKDWFNRDQFPLYGDNTFVCAADGSTTNRNRPLSDFESDVQASAAAPAAPEPTTIDEVITSRARFTIDHADVLRLYRAFFSRDPDVDGAQYWLDVLDGGQNPGQIAGHMSVANEFRQTFEGSSNGDFLLAVYRNALGRTPDNGGLAYWLGFLDRGELTRSEIVFYVAFGQEFRGAYPFGGK